MEIILQGTITGNLQSKANSRSVFRVKGSNRILFVKSKPAREWTAEAIIQLKGLWKQKQAHLGLVQLDGFVYYSSRRPDLSVELFMDALEKSGIIGNDRQIFGLNFKKRLDKEKPRVEFVLKEFED